MFLVSPQLCDPTDVYQQCLVLITSLSQIIRMKIERICSEVFYSYNILIITVTNCKQRIKVQVYLTFCDKYLLQRDICFTRLRCLQVQTYCLLCSAKYVIHFDGNVYKRAGCRGEVRGRGGGISAEHLNHSLLMVTVKIMTQELIFHQNSTIKFDRLIVKIMLQF